jgi:tRNA A-37 threonylcarbamoyl transferase component Bud32
MHENAAHPISKNNELPAENRVPYFEQRIDSLLEGLQSQGIDTRRWNEEYLEVPDDEAALESFHERLQSFIEQREEALLAFDFTKEYTDQEKERLKQFDREVRASFRDPDGFLGNGATAEVYSMPRNDTVCVKFIISQERYNENNHLRKEFHYLSKVFEHTKERSVTTPYPIFLRIHANEGHSYGMEKIQGASLSQILEQPEKYIDLLLQASKIDREKTEENLVEFIEAMHEVGVVHGDLYQRNIMLDREGRLYVIDFGKAHQIDYAGGKEDDRKLDEYIGRQSLKDFFDKIDLLTNLLK